MNIGIVSGGSIVREFLSVSHLLTNVTVTAIFTRRKSVAEELAAEYNIPRICGSFDELLAADSVDFVYIAVPNHLHFEFAKKALLSGKNVILEKPFTVTFNETKELCELAKERRLYLFEAISNLYSPVLSAIRAGIDKIGRIKSVRADYLQRSRRYDDFKNGIIHPVFDPEKHGGVMMDLGVYCLHLLVFIFGSPTHCKYMPKIEKGVDTEGEFRLDFDGFSAGGIISKTTDGECGLFIEGENGRIESRGKPNQLCEAVIAAGGDSTSYSGIGGSGRLTYEWNAFAEIYQNGDYDRMLSLLECTCRVAEVLEKFKN